MDLSFVVGRYDLLGSPFYQEVAPLERGKMQLISKKVVQKKAIPSFPAILSIGANDKCNIGQKPVCLSQAKPDEFAGFRYETQS